MVMGHEYITVDNAKDLTVRLVVCLNGRFVVILVAP